MRRVGIIVGVLAAMQAALAQEAAIDVDGAWARATPPGAVTAAAYLRIGNSGPDDRLVGARSSAAREIQIHTHVQRRGMLEMVRMDALALPGGETAVLEPGGDHLMLMDLAGPLAAGETIVITLAFENAGEVEITFPVVDARISSAGHSP